MTVASVHVPSECLELGFQVAQVADVMHPRVRLDLVVVDDGDDLGDLEVLADQCNGIADCLRHRVHVGIVV